MKYYFNKTLFIPFDKAIEKVTIALKEHGFGILSDINVSATMKAKLGEEFRPYQILGACNPPLAFKALQVEDKIGTMLPCNIIVQDSGNGTVEVAAVDPIASMQAVQSEALADVAREVRERLSAVIEAL